MIKEDVKAGDKYIVIQGLTHHKVGDILTIEAVQNQHVLIVGHNLSSGTSIPVHRDSIIGHSIELYSTKSEVNTTRMGSKNIFTEGVSTMKLNKTSYDKSIKFTAAIPGCTPADVTAKVKVSENDVDQNILVVKTKPNQFQVVDADGDMKASGAFKNISADEAEVYLPAFVDPQTITVRVFNGMLVISCLKYTEYVGITLEVEGQVAPAPVVEEAAAADATPTV